MSTSTYNISVNYLGLNLSSPLIPSASPLGENAKSIQEMEICGAGAVVLPSLFEDPYNPRVRYREHYLEELSKARALVKIPLIASVSATTMEGWIKLAQEVEKAGADALELNIYHLSLSPDVTSMEIEQSYINVVKAVTKSVKIPVAVKLPPFFTNMAYMAKALQEAGATGLVLFNRFYQPDLDLLSMSPGYTLRLSNSSENRLPLRWISLLYRQRVGDLAASTGIRTGADVLKMILCGASATQLCAVLLQRGVPWLKTIEEELLQWMDTCKINSLKEAQGILSHPCTQNPGQIEREEYSQALQGYARIDVPSWHDEIPVHV